MIHPKIENLFIHLIFILSLIEYVFLVCEVKYSGRTYVQEGQPFTITCRRSPYGSIPKWTKDGITLVPDESDNYTLYPTTEVKEQNLIVMKLHVDVADRKHRGKYKCDSSCSKAHRIDIVPLKETDEERTGVTILLAVNETLELYCADIDNSVFPINWYKDRQRILETDDPRISMEGRKLMVSGATQDDAGDYFCTVEVSGPGLSHPVADHLGYAIQVTNAASVEPFPPQIRPILGRNLTLECKVHGYPVPRVTWFIDNIPSEEFKFNNSRVVTMDNSEGLPNSVFFINNVTLDDVHKVMCHAENLKGSMETSVLLAVRENMISTNEDYPGKGIILTPGSELFLQCNTTDNPLLNVRWFKDGHAINMTDSRIHIDPHNNTLVIDKASETDTGNYMCDVEGSEEVINATIVVRTKVKLWSFENSRNVVQGQNINLRCNVSQGVPLPTLQWLKDGKPLNMSDSRIVLTPDEKGIADSLLTIKESDFDDRAEYMCVAANEVNSVNETILVRVKDKYAALWPFLGICVEVAVLCTIIFIYEKKRQKPDFDESDAEHNTENKTVPDKEEKPQDVRQRK